MATLEDVAALPGTPGYETATQVFNLAATVRPRYAMTARSVEEVRAAVRLAGQHGVPVRTLTTGHAAAAVRPITDGLLIRTDLAGAVTVDRARRLVRLPAGTRWAAVVAAAGDAGLAAPHGSSPAVGVVGYSLRGGLSWYGRKVGLAVNSVRAVELVTADGALRRVDAHQDPELFWALRGGGGGFGVVTALELELFAADQVITGASYWPARYAPALLTTWLRWAATAPPEITTSWRIMNLPPLPQVPPVLAAGPVVSVDGAVLGDPAHPDRAAAVAAELLDALAAIAEPIFGGWQRTDPAGVLAAHMEPTDPVAVIGDHMLLRELDDAGAAALCHAIGAGSGSPLVVAGLRQLGGAYRQGPTGGGALNHLDAAFSYAGSGVPDGPITPADLRLHCQRVRAALRPWDTGRTVPSFVEHHSQPQGHLREDEVRMLDQIRDRVDPHGLFRADVTTGATTR